MVDKLTIEELKTEIKGEEGPTIRSVNILFMDVSSTCCGYDIAEVDFESKKAIHKSAGAIWLNPDWSHQEKYSYMFNALVNYFWISEQIDYIIVEQYSINPKKMVGICVVPEMIGAIKTAAWENGIKVASFLPQSWRSELKIKPVVTGRSRDYKEPTKQRVEEFVKVPEESISNISNNARKTPSDLYDAIALSIGWLKRMGFEKQEFGKLEFNKHIGAINQ